MVVIKQFKQQMNMSSKACKFHVPIMTLASGHHHPPQPVTCPEGH